MGNVRWQMAGTGESGAPFLALRALIYLITAMPPIELSLSDHLGPSA